MQPPETLAQVEVDCPMCNGTGYSQKTKANCKPCKGTGKLKADI